MKIISPHIKYMQNAFSQRWNALGLTIKSSPIYISLALLALFIVIIPIAMGIYPSLKEGYWSGVFIEFHGMIFDIAVFGIVIAAFTKSINRRLEMQRQQEIIDDYKKWNSEEGKLRIAGAIRRINRLGRTDVNFSGIELRGFSFREHDIKSIRGSSFYDGTWGEGGSRDKVKLMGVSFSGVDCRDVRFSRFNPFSGLVPIVCALFEDCDFQDAELTGSVFKGAHLAWTAEHPDELGEVDENEDGSSSFIQTHYPAFSGVDLSEVSFEDVTFRNADFRGSENLEMSNLKNVKGLETCLYNSENVKQNIINISNNYKQE